MVTECYFDWWDSHLNEPQTLTLWCANPEDYLDKNNVVGIAYFLQQSNALVKVSIAISNFNSNSSLRQIF